MPQKERPNERMAREIVAETLRVPVSCHDDNTQGSMVDALIHYPDGSLGAMEIVADHDDRFNKMWDALEKVGHSLPVVGLRGRNRMIFGCGWMCLVVDLVAGGCWWRSVGRGRSRTNCGS